jgi:hypothetical protein
MDNVERGPTVVTFMIVAVAGLAVLVLSAVVDGVGDALDFGGGGSGLISGASIGGLISGIGFGGFLGITLSDTVWVIALISGGTGLAVAAAAAIWYRWLQRAQGDEKDLAMSGIVGTEGAIRTVSQEDPAMGTVAVTYLGASRTMQAIADEPLKRGQVVTVTHLVDPETVRVAPADASQ